MDEAKQRTGRSAEQVAAAIADRLAGALPERSCRSPLLDGPALKYGFGRIVLS
jgi:hypothetical protein